MSFEKNLIVLGKDRLDTEKFRKIKNKIYKNKPEGGLWTSPEKSNWGWKDFVISEKFLENYYLSGNLIFITLKDSAKIYKIDSEFDFMSCPFRNKTKEECEICKFSFLDFEKLSEKYDALWITERAINENSSWICSEDRLLGPLYGWDVETVLLFNLECIESYA